MTPRDIDLATIRTWPAAITEQRQGWYYLAASGVTGRVNAVWPIDWSGDDIDAAIDDAEAWYAAHNLPARFKLTDGAYAPTNLTTHLARRGYEPVNPTLIMTSGLTAEPGHHEDVTLSPTLSPLFDQALRDSTPNADDLEERRAIARRLPQPAAFAVRERDNRAVAVGASAVADQLTGIFLMRTVPEARRQGHALHILRALMQWAAPRTLSCKSTPTTHPPSRSTRTKASWRSPLIASGASASSPALVSAPTIRSCGLPDR